MLEWLQQGGYAVWPAVVFGLLTIVAAVRYAFNPERRLVPLVISAGVLTLLIGGGGCVTGLIKSLTALPRAAPQHQWIWLVGLGESLVSVAVGLVLASLAGLAMTVGAWRLARQAA